MTMLKRLKKKIKHEGHEGKNFEKESPSKNEGFMFKLRASCRTNPNR
jgi:hypothetical protein